MNDSSRSPGAALFVSERESSVLRNDKSYGSGGKRELLFDVFYAGRVRLRRQRTVSYITNY